MASHSAQPFRFMDLPGELRNQVYTLLLCSFGHPSEKNLADFQSPLESAGQRADTAILLISRQVHREAYDIMVKANRFIVVRTTTALPFTTMIKESTITVITTNEQHISHFRGYMLAVTLSESTSYLGPWDEPPMSAILLARDLPSFCETLNRGNFGRTVTVDVKVAPLLGEPTSPYKDTFEAFFSEETQRSLLAPFVTCIRGFENVRVHGYVSPQLAITTAEDMRKDEWSDPTELLRKLQSEKDDAGKRWAEGSRHAAAAVWDHCMLDVGRIRESSSWSNLVFLGGDSFVGKLVELRFLCCLNYAHAIFAMFTAAMEDGKVAKMRKTLVSMTERTILVAQECMTPDYWQEGRTWVPSDLRLAKLCYRQAIITLFHGDIADAAWALAAIDIALSICPNDKYIQEVHTVIVKWHESGRNFDADRTPLRTYV